VTIQEAAKALLVSPSRLSQTAFCDDVAGIPWVVAKADLLAWCAANGSVLAKAHADWMRTAITRKNPGAVRLAAEVYAR
jgi:hypothetical protein